jgi:hypothetical protein
LWKFILVKINLWNFIRISLYIYIFNELTFFQRFRLASQRYFQVHTKKIPFLINKWMRDREFSVLWIQNAFTAHTYKKKIAAPNCNKSLLGKLKWDTVANSVYRYISFCNDDQNAKQQFIDMGWAQPTEKFVKLKKKILQSTTNKLF